ncbi:MAG: mechanosensitive ion channel [Alphaproteobacteria bacterium]|nr:mechanosensitive ion channel [Alphaproteobacteria bacterium]
MELGTFWSVALRVLYAIGILFAANVVGGWATGMAAMLLDRTKLDPLVRRMLVRLVRPLVLLLGIAAVLHILALDSVSTAIAAMLGGATLAIGLALRSYLSDAAAGALLLSNRPFSAGDIVTVNGVNGTIVDIGVFWTRVADFDGNTRFVPNSKVASNVIENISLKGTRRINEPIGLGRSADIAQVRALILARVEADARLLADPAPAVVVTKIRDDAVEIAVRVWTTNADFGAAGADLRENILADLATHDIPAPRAGLAVALSGSAS